VLTSVSIVTTLKYFLRSEWCKSKVEYILDFVNSSAKTFLHFFQNVCHFFNENVQKVLFTTKFYAILSRVLDNWKILWLFAD